MPRINEIRQRTGFTTQSEAVPDTGPNNNIFQGIADIAQRKIAINQRLKAAKLHTDQSNIITSLDQFSDDFFLKVQQGKVNADEYETAALNHINSATQQIDSKIGRMELDALVKKRLANVRAQITRFQAEQVTKAEQAAIKNNEDVFADNFVGLHFKTVERDAVFAELAALNKRSLQNQGFTDEQIANYLRDLKEDLHLRALEADAQIDPVQAKAAFEQGIYKIDRGDDLVRAKDLLERKVNAIESRQKSELANQIEIDVRRRLDANPTDTSVLDELKPFVDQGLISPAFEDSVRDRIEANQQQDAAVSINRKLYLEGVIGNREQALELVRNSGLGNREQTNLEIQIEQYHKSLAENQQEELKKGNLFNFARQIDEGRFDDISSDQFLHDLYGMVDEGAISPGHVDVLANRHISATTQKRRNQLLVNLGNQPGPLNPGDKLHVEAVNAAYQSLIASIPDDISASQQAREIASFVSRKNIVPKALKDELSMANATRSTKYVEPALMKLNAMRAMAEGQMDQIKESDYEFLYPVMRLVNNGVEVGEAIQIVRERENIDPDLRKQRISETSISKIQEDVAQAVHDQAEDEGLLLGRGLSKGLANIGILSFTDTTNEMIADAVNVTQEMYQSKPHYELEDAIEDAAQTVVNRLYGVTHIGGEARIMKHSPEAMLNVETDVIEEDMRRAALKFGITEDKKLLLHSDNITKNFAPPSWLLLAEDENGFMQPIIGDDDLPERYSFDIEKYSREVEEKRIQLGDESIRRQREIRKNLENMMVPASLGFFNVNSPFQARRLIEQNRGDE